MSFFLLSALRRRGDSYSSRGKRMIPPSSTTPRLLLVFSYLSLLTTTNLLLLLLIALDGGLQQHSFVHASSTTGSTCNLIASMDEGTNQIEYKCEQDDMVYSIDNHSSEFEELLLHSERRGLFSGMQLDIQGGYISNDGRYFVIPSDADIGFPRTLEESSGVDGGDSSRAGRRRHRQLYRNASGSQTVLVVYVRDASGGKPDKNPSGFTNSIEDDVFGTRGDSLNLSNVYESCSNDALDFVPFVGKTTTNVDITNGVAEITIPETVVGSLVGDIENSATLKAQQVLGNLRAQFNYVIFCLPSGATRPGGSGWLAYAYIDHWKSVYNNPWCSSISALAHEIGHNLNLGHSGQGADQYGDQVGFMGYSYSSDDGPSMCFNAPKTHQLGWFPAHHVDLTAAEDYKYTGNLYGFADVTKLGGDADKKMIVKLIGNSGVYSESYSDYYISFNRKTGNNAGTREGADMVVIHSSQYAYWAPKSLRVADLQAGQSTVITNVKGLDVIVEVTEINLAADPAYAAVRITADVTLSPSLSVSPSKSPSPSQVPSGSLMPTASLAPSLMYYSLSTEYLFGEYYAASKSGVMFDILTTDDVMISKLDVSFFFVGGTGVSGIETDIEIYVKDGTYIGSENKIGRWTLHMARTTVTPSSTDFLTTIDESMFPPLFVEGGKTKAMFITNRDAKNYLNLAYTNTALDYSDGTVTIQKGKFAKYEYFANLGHIDMWENIPFAFTGIMYYKLSANFPSSEPSRFPSIAPTTSFAPSTSQVPSLAPSVSIEPSSKPSTSPSSKPSVSVSPSSIPSDSPSANPSVSMEPSATPTRKPTGFPTVSPTFKPSINPTNNPTPSPSKRPTRMPSNRPSRTQDPSGISPSDGPSVSLVPTMTVSNHPSLAPIVSTSPSMASLSPSIKRFQVVTTTAIATYPFAGISQEQLSARFQAMIALWTKAITAKVPKDKWGVRITRVGDRDVRRTRLLSAPDAANARFLQSDVIDVEVEFTNVNICESDGGCTESDVNESYQEGLDVLSAVVESVESGALVQTIKEEAAAVGLSDVVAEISVDEVVTQVPRTEVVDPTPFPTIDITAPPSSSPTRSGPLPHRCDDSPLRFIARYNDKVKYKDCEWVARHPNWKCQLDGVASHCPSTCNACGTCSDSTARFLLDSSDPTESNKACEWAARRDTQARCALPGIAQTCRATCDNCCSDSPNEFTFIFNDKQVTKSCEW
eukprot:CAMPEP_0176486396 /NCGR_PEP_ID=MMETSP0200_2-20121128/5545_1 /TAXON_ID=947934 /ORGANISM="Chaetoceros sp., Strain GSL56" /LENGTH=1213 /DNA_ID=CAMNT_0017883093 /DNA_START=414 /DNA_END=4052 /DNA_ORIENTATION=-